MGNPLGVEGITRSTSKTNVSINLWLVVFGSSKSQGLRVGNLQLRISAARRIGCLDPLLLRETYEARHRFMLQPSRYYPVKEEWCYWHHLQWTPCPKENFVSCVFNIVTCCMSSRCWGFWPSVHFGKSSLCNCTVVKLYWRPAISVAT